MLIGSQVSNQHEYCFYEYCSLNQPIVWNACSRSAMMSSTSSIPTERRIRSGATPASINCSSVSWRCVWLAGCSMHERASATCVTMAISFRVSMKRMASSLVPLMPNASTPQAPLGRYLFASALYLLLGRPQKFTHSTMGCASRYSATFCAFSQWRGIRRCSVSRPRLSGRHFRVPSLRRGRASPVPPSL